MDNYSPYDNVTAQDYPAMLITAALNDRRVSYWEPSKWVAKLRYCKLNDSLTPLLFRIDMDSGHSGSSDRYKYIQQTALEYAFIIQQIVIKQDTSQTIRRLPVGESKKMRPLWLEEEGSDETKKYPLCWTIKKI